MVAEDPALAAANQLLGLIREDENEGDEREDGPLIRCVGFIYGSCGVKLKCNLKSSLTDYCQSDSMCQFIN